MLARARYDGLAVTADVSAHHLHLTETALYGFNGDCHVVPPLRTGADRTGLRHGLAEGTLAAVCSDHQPHEPDAKLAPFCATEPGMSALETLLPLTLRLVEEGVLGLAEALARVTSGPAQVLGIEAGRIGIGDPADVCIFDPQRRWALTEKMLVSRGHNTPFLGHELKGKVIHTLLGGRAVYSEA